MEIRLSVIKAVFLRSDVSSAAANWHRKLLAQLAGSLDSTISQLIWALVPSCIALLKILVSPPLD
ncbi:hypothetical protein NQ317_007396 [Molorchus minor]|uniref:Uncharacterized protein n=1 Tax=Molorchus minor TaxID=1323400 RepID=A0ABQ9JUG7_9CUCU|nr:hypothetical protein NQ317_007396 [Molorchus minor]